MKTIKKTGGTQAFASITSLRILCFACFACFAVNLPAQTTLSGDHVITGDLDVGTTGTPGNLKVTGTTVFLENVGIGTSNPQFSLTVSATTNHIASFSDNAGGTFNIVVADELLETGHPAPLGSIGNGGGVLQLKYGGDDAEWGRIVYLDSSGNLGLGDVVPGAKFHVHGNAIISNDPEIDPSDMNVKTLLLGPRPDGYPAASLGLQMDSGNKAVIEYNQGLEPGVLGFCVYDNGFPDGDPSFYHLVIAKSGNVGIGTDNPAAKLDVNGNLNFTGTLFQNGTPFTSGGGWTTSGTNAVFGSGNVGIGTNSPQSPLDVRSGGVPIRFGDGSYYGYLSAGGVGNEVGLIGSLDNAIAVVYPDNNSYAYGGGILNVSSAGSVAVSSPSSDMLSLRNFNHGTGIDFISTDEGFEPGYGSTGAAAFGVNVGDPNSIYIKYGNPTQWGRLVHEDTVGNVGIGTTVPTAKLDVNGGMRISENLAHSGTGSFSIVKGSASLRLLAADEYGDYGNSIMLASGGGTAYGGTVSIAGASALDTGGSIALLAGSGDATSGKISLSSGESYNGLGGTIELLTGSGGEGGGDIVLKTGGGNEESQPTAKSGNIILSATGTASGGKGRIQLHGARVELLGVVAMERQGDILMGEFGNPE